MRKLAAMVLWFGLSALGVAAQGVSVQGQAVVNTTTSVSGIPGNSVLQAVPGATITVCSSVGGGIPCSPLVTIYSNAALSVVLSNPFTADANGNFQFFVAPNATGYLYSVTGSTITGQLYTILPQSTVGSAGTGTITASAGQSVYASGLNALTGGTVVLDMAGINGTDLGAKMNNCAAQLPSSGGTCKGDNLTGTLTLSTSVTTSKAVVYTFCGQNVTQSANINLNNVGAGLLGCSPSSVTFTKAANIDQITNGGTVQGITLAGVGGSFTGNGIVTSASTSITQFNSITGETGAGISAANGGTVQFNTVGSTSSGHAITSNAPNAKILFNTVTSSISDAIYVTGSPTLVQGNIVGLTPGSGNTGLCGINFNSDQIGNHTFHNIVTINDVSNSGNTDNGICDTAVGTHNMNMLFDGDQVIGVVSGTVTQYGYLINDVASLANNWSVVVRNVSCVHVGQPVSSGSCLKIIDTNNNLVVWDDVLLGDTQYYDGTTTSTGGLFVSHQPPLAFAALPSPAANGSQVYCSNCTNGGGVTTAGGTGSYITRVNGQWYGKKVSNWTWIQGKEQNAAAGSLNVTLPNHVNPGDIIVVGIECNQAAQPTFAVSDTLNGTFSSAIAIKGDPGPTKWEQLFYFPGVVGAATAGETVAVASSVNVCTFIDVFVNEYAGILYAASPLDGAGSSSNGNGTTLTTGSYTVTPGDLVVAFGLSTVGTMAGGSGTTTRQTGAGGASLFQDIVALTTTTNQQMGAASGNWAISGVAFKVAP